MMVQAIGIGIVISCMFTECVGLYAGGLIVPGYFAFFGNQPLRILVSLLVALAAYSVISGLSNVIILYGRRRFMATVLISYLLGELCRILITDYLSVSQDLRVIGYIIPGLIANDMVKQGVWRTIVAVLIVSIIVRLILLLMFSL